MAYHKNKAYDEALSKEESRKMARMARRQERLMMTIQEVGQVEETSEDKCEEEGNVEAEGQGTWEITQVRQRNAG